jgi:hypothetical protein
MIFTLLGSDIFRRLFHTDDQVRHSGDNPAHTTWVRKVVVERFSGLKPFDQCRHVWFETPPAEVPLGAGGQALKI